MLLTWACHNCAISDAACAPSFSGFPTGLSILIDGGIVSKLPTAPPGKKLGIDQAKMHLILLNQ